MKVTGLLLDTLLFWRKDKEPRIETGSIVGFRLLRANSGAVVTDVLRNGTKVYLNDTKIDLTLQAITSASLGLRQEVRFDWNGKQNAQTESTAPYTLCGGKFKACSSLSAGSHTVSAMVVSHKKAFTVQFDLVAGVAPTVVTTASPTPGLRSVTKAPVPVPAILPSSAPTTETMLPTSATLLPTTAGTYADTATPTFPWTEIPTSSPSRSPVTKAPVRRRRRTRAPTKKPTSVPTKKPTKAPTKAPIRKRVKKTNAPVPVKKTLAPKVKAPRVKAPKAKAPTVKQAPLPAPMVTTTGSPITGIEAPAAPAQTPVTETTLAPAQTPVTETTLAPAQTPVTETTSAPAQTPVTKTTSAPAQTPVTGTTLAPVNGDVTTVAPSTLAPTMLATPVASATLAPTTFAPVQTLAPVTRAPLAAGTTAAPVLPTTAPVIVTRVPVTKAPIATKKPVTIAPTKAPVTVAPTKAPVTKAPITLAPVPLPTLAPVTRAPKTMAPILAGTTQVPTLPPVSPAPVTPAPITKAPTKAPASAAPVVVPTKAPVTAAPVLVPTNAPVVGLTPAPVTVAPVIVPTNAPVAAITPAPVTAITPAPVTAITPAPVTAAPVIVPTNAPVTGAPVVVPTQAPVAIPTKAPVAIPTKAPLKAGFQPILIDCGSDEEYVDQQGRMWKEYNYFNGGNIYAVNEPILGSNNQPLVDYEMYHTQRFGNYKYEIPVPSGEYEVVILLAETYFELDGGRVFDLDVEGSMIKDIDMFKITGKRYKTCDKKVEVMVTDGKLTVEVFSKKDWGSIGGLEIHRIGNAAPVAAPVTPAPTPAPAFKTIRIGCGRDTPYTDVEGRVWSKDMYFNQGNAYFAPWIPVSDTQDQVLFQGERYGVFDYKIELPDGDYTVTLYFAEIYHKNVGDRVFNIGVEDFTYDDYDVIEQAGGPETAVSMEATVIVQDGVLNIDLKAGKKDNPKLSAIKVEALGERRL